LSYSFHTCLSFRF